MEISLQAYFNEKDKRSKEKWLVESKGNFYNFGGRESQSSNNSTCQRGESSYNKNGGQGNLELKGRGLTKVMCSALIVKS